MLFGARTEHKRIVLAALEGVRRDLRQQARRAAHFAHAPVRSELHKAA